MIKNIESLQLRKGGKDFFEIFRINHSKSIANNNIKKIIRKFVISHLLAYSNKYDKFSKLVYFVRVAYMNTQISKKKYLDEIIKKWRFFVSMRKFAKNKMSDLYKNMDQVYNTVAEEIFGNDKDSVKNNYTDLAEKLGAFTHNSDQSLISSSYINNNIIKAKMIYKFDNKLFDNNDIIKDQEQEIVKKKDFITDSKETE